jgi:pimeloyl-ACP methyl ester carboxylesterase
VEEVLVHPQHHAASRQGHDNLIPYLCEADFVVIPKTGHLIPLEAPADLVDAITAFAPAA